jgi:hypothetical protein
MFLPRCAFVDVRVGVDFRRERLGKVMPVRKFTLVFVTSLSVPLALNDSEQ